MWVKWDAQRQKQSYKVAKCQNWEVWRLFISVNDMLYMPVLWTLWFNCIFNMIIKFHLITNLEKWYFKGIIPNYLSNELALISGALISQINSWWWPTYEVSTGLEGALSASVICVPHQVISRLARLYFTKHNLTLRLTEYSWGEYFDKNCSDKLS